MEEKVREIEERVNHPVKRYLYGGSFRDWKDADGDVDYLLTCIKELQQDLDREITYKDALGQAEARIRRLEQSNDNWMIQVRLNYTRIKELEEELDKIRRTQDYFINKPQID